MSSWLKSRLVVIEALFFVPLPIIIAICIWGIPALATSFVLIIIFASALAAFGNKIVSFLWCLIATTSSAVALYCLALTSPTLLPGSLLLGGFLYPLLYLVMAIVLFPKLKD